MKLLARGQPREQESLCLSYKGGRVGWGMRREFGKRSGALGRLDRRSALNARGNSDSHT